MLEAERITSVIIAVSDTTVDEIPLNAVEFMGGQSKLEIFLMLVPIIIFIYGCVYIKSNFLGEYELNLLGYITFNSMLFILSARCIGSAVGNLCNLVHAIKEMTKGSVMMVLRLLE